MAEELENSTGFPSPFDFNGFLPLTLVELRMRLYSGEIREKPFWWDKIHDAAIVAKWREEIVESDRAEVERLWGGQARFEDGHGEKQWPRDPITDAQLEYIFEELRHEASKRDAHTGVFVSVLPSHVALI